MWQPSSEGISPGAIMVRDSTWSAPSYDDLSLMEQGIPRPSALLGEAFKKIPGDNWYAKLQHCSSCKCCARHQTFRPSRLVPWTDDTVKYKEPEDQLPICECDCRHMARFICRQVIVNCNDDRTMPPCPRASPIIEDPM